MYIGCVNSVVNHNFTLTRALLQCLHSLCTYMDIFTTDYLPHTAGGSGNPMAVAHSYGYKLFVATNTVDLDVTMAYMGCHPLDVSYTTPPLKTCRVTPTPR